MGEGGGVMGDGIFCCLICFEGQRLLSFPEVHISKQRMYVDTTKRNGDIEWETSSAWPGIYYLWMKKLVCTILAYLNSRITFLRPTQQVCRPDCIVPIPVHFPTRYHLINKTVTSLTFVPVGPVIISPSISRSA